jgi:nucleoside-diphosphate-sugar epimerase
MKMFVTGGTGFLGKRLVRRLVADGHQVRCLVRPGGGADSFSDPATVPNARNPQAVRCSLDRIDDCAGAIRDSDVVIHAAAAMNGGAAVLFANNVVTTRRLVALAGEAGVKRFVLISSLGVYGVSHLKRGDGLDEACPLDPKPYLRDAYSYSKIEQENVAWQAHAERNLPLVVVRPGVIYGPGRGCLSTRVGLQLGRVMVRMGGRQQVPYTYVDNCAAAIAAAATTPGIEGEAINVVDDDLPTARRLLARYRKEVQRLRVVPIPGWAISPLSGMSEWYHRWSNGQLPAVLTRYKSASQWKRLTYPNDKAKRLLGWAPSTSVEEGLRESCAWLRQQLGVARQQAA